MPTPYARKLLPLCNELSDAAFKIAGQADVKITENTPLEPKFLALALLCRTLGNFKGVVLLLEQGLLVEARVLTRCCFENQFIIGGLYTKGAEFAQLIKADDVAGRKARVKFVTDTNGISQGLSQETRDEMTKAKTWLTALKGSYLKAKDAAAAGPFNEVYLAYSQYSGDAAHPTFTALMRHCIVEDENLTFDVVPLQIDDQLDDTLHLASISLLSVSAIVNEMCGNTAAGELLPELNARFQTLQTGRFGINDICQGLEK
jgi:hypothetical protein